MCQLYDGTWAYRNNDNSKVILPYGRVPSDEWVDGFNVPAYGENNTVYQIPWISQFYNSNTIYFVVTETQ